MKRKLMTFTAGFACFLLAFPFCVSASDATHIAFTSDRDGNAEIYIMDTNGKNLQNLTNHPARDSQPAFSPDGQWMAFVSDRSGTNRIYLMNRHNNELRPLTNHLKSEAERDPDWSPDGQWIAFAHWHSGHPTNIYKIDVNGKNLKQLTNAGYNRVPAWSPGGQQIVFYSAERRDGSGIYVMQANGRGVKRIMNEGRWGSVPSWSPDGKKIAYVNLASSGIHIMNTEGQDLQRLTPAKTWSYSPAWSPEGQWIAYELELVNPWGNLNRDSNIHLVSPDGAETRQLTEHPARDHYPAWVPASFLSVSPAVNTQTTLWGSLKQPIHD